MLLFIYFQNTHGKAVAQDKFTVWHFEAKGAAVRFVKSWTSGHFSESRDQAAATVRPRVQNIPEKIGEARSAATPSGKAARRSSKNQVEWLHPRPCLVLFWCGARGAIRDCCSESSWGCCPRDPPQRKRGRENEWVLSWDLSLWGFPFTAAIRRISSKVAGIGATLLFWITAEIAQLPREPSLWVLKYVLSRDRWFVSMRIFWRCTPGAAMQLLQIKQCTDYPLGENSHFSRSTLRFVLFSFLDLMSTTSFKHKGFSKISEKRFCSRPLQSHINKRTQK